MRLRLKKELCFVYNHEGIEVYYGNAQLNKLITTENNSSFFKFSFKRTYKRRSTTVWIRRKF